MLKLGTTIGLKFLWLNFYYPQHTWASGKKNYNKDVLRKDVWWLVNGKPTHCPIQ